MKGDKNWRTLPFSSSRILFSCADVVEEEKQMAMGQIDLVAHFRNIIMVMELKLDNNGGVEAAKQIDCRP